MEKLNAVFFYHLEKAIKSYRQQAQANLNAKGFDITIDQWLILHTLTDNPGITQKELARLVFKDQASVTRMIELLVRNNFLQRSANTTNRRSNTLTVTRKGGEIIRKIMPTVLENRQGALHGLTQKDILTAEKVLKTIAANCGRND